MKEFLQDKKMNHTWHFIIISFFNSFISKLRHLNLVQNLGNHLLSGEIVSLCLV